VSDAGAALPLATHALIAHASAVVDFANLKSVVLREAVSLHDDGFSGFSMNYGRFSIDRKCITTVMHDRLEIVVAAFRRGLPLVKR